MKGFPAIRNSAFALTVALAAFSLVLPELAFAQSSPFATGATSFQTNFLTILTPIAVISVMALGLAALFGRISWSWAIGGIAGVVLVFGAPQLVTWVRGMFGV